MRTCSVAALLVVYKPDVDRLERVLCALSGQVQQILIYDNSNSGFNFGLEIDCEVEIYNSQSNMGIAYAQNYLTVKAFDEYAADYILELDQDTVLPANYVSKLLEVFSSFDVTSVAAAAGVKEGDISSKTLKCVDYIRSSGLLISKNSFCKVGVRREGYFIDFVDWEWCWRARSMGLKIVIDPKLVMDHCSGVGSVKVLFVTMGVSVPVRNYYQARNALLCCREKHIPIRFKLMILSKLVIRFISIPFFDKRVERFRYYIRGLGDGLTNKTGAYNA